MNTPERNFLRLRYPIIFACFVFGLLGSANSQTPDINKIWTTVGSTGTVDEADISKIVFDRSRVQMGALIGGNQPASAVGRSLAIQQTQSAVIRYNISPVEGLFAVKAPCFTQTGSECPGIQLQLRYLSSGRGSRVTANLIEVDLNSGTEVTRLSFDSSSFSVVNGYQVQSVAQCGPATPRQPFDFARKAYYVEAQLTASSIIAGSAAGIQIIKVANIGCIG